MSKWQTNTNKYSKLIFVDDPISTKEIKSIIKNNEIVFSRGTKLEARLNELIAKKQT